MRNLRDKVIAITGAGSGIGRALAVQLAEERSKLAICDIDESSVLETADALNGSCRVMVAAVDVSKRIAVESWAADVVKVYGHVDVIINNAGVCAKGAVEELSYDDFHWVIDINLWGVIHGVKAFVPYMKLRPESHIVNISSLNAFVPFPENSPYNISKYAVAGFSETLMQELRGTRISVTCVHPGGVDTNIVRRSRNYTEDEAALFQGLARVSADQAARAIICGIKRNKQRLVIGADATLLSICKRILPMTTVWATGRWFDSIKSRNSIDSS
jgi:NAD(P)-dependent dehydrogenase (short-subunit alcohol dehydrogenase family)